MREWARSTGCFASTYSWGVWRWVSCLFLFLPRRWSRPKVHLRVLSSFGVLTRNEDRSIHPWIREWAPSTGCGASSYSCEIGRWVSCVVLFLPKGRSQKMVHQPIKHISFDLWCTHKNLRWINFPMDEGMGPVNWLLSKCLFMRSMKVSPCVELFLARDGSQEIVSMMNHISDNH